MSWASDWIGLRLQLRRAREAAGLRQVDVAAHLGISVRHFARLESAEIDPQARVLFAWADCLGLRVRMERRTNMSGGAETHGSLLAAEKRRAEELRGVVWSTPLPSPSDAGGSNC